MTPNVADIFDAEANRLDRERTEHWQEVLAGALEAVKKEPSDETARIRATNSLRKLRRNGEAISFLQEGLGSCTSAALHQRLAEMLAECNRTGEAIAAAQSGLRVFPSDVLLRMTEALLLPVLYDSPAEIDRYRARFAAGLNRLCREIRLDTPHERLNALAALGSHTNFYLGYQCRNDRDLQAEYGALAHRIMAASHPQWTRPLPMPPSPAGEPLRIGYVSARFRDLSATRFFYGWLRGHDLSRIQVHAWHVSAQRDRATDAVASISHRFCHFPGAAGNELLCHAAESIRSANLHVLVFLDIGIDPVMTQLAALRLAPVQCMAWDQPITSGLPTVDYALSSDLAEPGNARDHYSEQLVRLPGVGVSYARPAIPWPLLRKTRRDFNLREGSIVYLCCQSVFKFLPQNDDVFVRIALRVPDSQFVFLVTTAETGAALFERLDRAFRAANLRAHDHCVLLPQLKHLDYWNLHGVADVFLDTIGWSSGGSVFEAVACGVPVVTMPGEFMRGRQGFAILSQLGVADTIASGKEGYIDSAIRLGLQDTLRRDVTARMELGYPLLYSDPRSTRALEEFYRAAVESAATPSNCRPSTSPLKETV